MNLQLVIVLLCVGAALMYLLRPWWGRVRARAAVARTAGGETSQPSACGACRGCSGRSSGCH
ncbi:hypothetical protein [Hydrogenophaga pseudoflava]|uniref:hypothetical protein n=1 Tax=Hydrogenophaga pseudoflava TaxID=47421 RepID=UPI0027E4D9FF|nr:hypothetical protein [Hydrogenophaga pseudoflava]MDQ7746852.1 hypothetical protein [Hydrogenophaga pseudoflava]